MQKLVNSGVPEKYIHSTADLLRGRTSTGATAVKEKATSKLNRLTQHQATVKKKRKAASSIHHPKKKRKTTGKTLSQLIDQV